MALAFRNLTVSPEDPVEEWGFEGLLAAVDRGDLSDWRRIIEAVQRDPWGEVSQTLDEVLALAEDAGAVGAIDAARSLARRRHQAGEKADVAARMTGYLTASGLSRAEFARRLGTSTSRLSTYLSGKVTPSAVLMLRAERIAAPESRRARR
jgi:DNA-binding transcriptional regulator YiaG